MRDQLVGLLMLLLVLATLGAWVLIFHTYYRLSKLCNTKHPLLRIEGKPVGALFFWVLLATPASMLASAVGPYSFVLGAIYIGFPFVYYLRVRSRWKRETCIKP